MNDSHITDITQIHEFLKGAPNLSFKKMSRDESYDWISSTLRRFRYFSLTKKDKSAVKAYAMRMTGYSDAQMTRLIDRQKKKGEIKCLKGKRNRFGKKYTVSDIARLAETDRAHSRLSGPATKKIFERMYCEFGDQRYERLANISNGQIYNLRKTRWYVSETRFFAKTKKTTVSIAARKKPNPDGKPGYLRVDSVHQGDKGKEKGVYHINVTDEATQWEIVRAAENISHHFMVPILKDIIESFPFEVLGFHSDNGSEYVNRQVADMLNELLIEQTKSRPLKTNDNALSEGKNGSVVRKHMGYAHIPQENADLINEFYRGFFDEYLNFHRPCGFATVRKDRKGKERKVYDTYLTPYAKLKSIKNRKKFLKKGITLKCLDRYATRMTDNECAAQMQQAKEAMLSTVTR